MTGLGTIFRVYEGDILFYNKFARTEFYHCRTLIISHIINVYKHKLYISLKPKYMTGPTPGR